MELVSIIMPAYNASSTIGSAINSVIAQSYDNWKLVVVNDASQDNTLDLINEFATNDNRILVVDLQENGGLSNARNEGIKNASGKFVTFLDSDDLWYPDKLLKQISFHDSYPEIEISHSDYNMFDEKGVVKRPFKKIVEFNYKKKGFLIPLVYCKNTIGILTIMIDRELLVKTGGFDTSLWTMEDQDLWVRIAKSEKYFGYINETLASYRLNSNGLSHNIVKYKNAYKAFINKYKGETIQLGVYDIVLANYYRYFGISYFKKRKYKISILYLSKSIKFERFILNKITTSLYFLKALFKYFLA